MTRPRHSGSLRFALSLALSLAPLAATSPAHAEPTAEERAAARALFDEGRGLMAAGNFPAACPKLEEAMHIDPGIGTQFNLADCQEHLGKLASAWGNFIDAAGKAKAAGQEERAQAARDRAAALAPRLSKLIIVAGDPTGTLVVNRDGSPIHKAVWGTALPVDPGDHVVSASAPGKKPWQTTVNVKAEGASITITVPPLVDLPKEIVPPPVRPEAPQPQGLAKQRIAAIGVGGLGLIGVIAGAALAGVAKSKYDASLDYCPDKSKPNVCYGPAQDLRNSALAAGTGSTIAFVIGGLAVAGGVVVWVLNPKPKAAAPPAKAVGVGAMIGDGLYGLSLTGRY